MSDSLKKQIAKFMDKNTRELYLGMPSQECVIEWDFTCDFAYLNEPDNKFSVSVDIFSNDDGENEQSFGITVDSTTDKWESVKPRLKELLKEIQYDFILL